MSNLAVQTVDKLISAIDTFNSMTDDSKQIEKAAACDQQTSLTLTTKYTDSDGKQQSNVSGIPQIGLGTWQSPPNKVKEAVRYALQIGYRHIDCAHCYGNEHEVGDGLVQCLQDGTVTREQVFITSKLWNTDHHPDDVASALQQTLDNLQLDYIDLYLMHWPYNFRRTRAEYEEKLKQLNAQYKDDKTSAEYAEKYKALSLQLRFPKNADGSMQYGDVVPIIDTWKAMEKLVIAGKVKHIGLSNFNKAQVSEVLKASQIKPVMVQCECHPYLNQSELIAFCQQNGVQFTCYSPLGSPKRPNQNKYYPVLLEDTVVDDIAKQFANKSNAHVLIRFAVDRNLVVIPKSVTPSRIKSNLEVFDIKLSTAQIQQLLAINRNLRYCAPTSQLPDGTVVYRDGKHPNFPFPDEKVISEKDFTK